MADGIIERSGGPGVYQSREASGKFGGKAMPPEEEPIEVRDESAAEPQVLERSKLPTQANRVTRGPEVVG